VRHGTALPGWADLEPSTNRKRTASGDTFLQNVSTVRFALLILAVAGLFTLYVGHVHATTDLYNQLQQARAENQRLHLKHNRLKGEFDHRTGPSVIYERARELGLQESVTYGPPITVE
jgi:cell division protein FtsL